MKKPEEDGKPPASGNLMFLTVKGLFSDATYA